MSIQKTILFSAIKRKFNLIANQHSKEFGEVTRAVIESNYKKEVINFDFSNGKKSISIPKPLAAAAEMNDVFLGRIKKKTSGKIENIEICILTIDFIKKETTTEIYYKLGNEYLKTIISDLF